MRSVGIINRSLPPDQKLRVYHTSGRISGEEFDSGAWRGYLGDGSIWAGFAEKPILGDCGGDRAAGCATLHAPGTRFARTVTKGVAHVYPVVVDSAESQVDVMVHEIMHALGIEGHPQDVHTSIMSYEHDDSGILDNLPLIDAAILYDLNGWGLWDRRTDWTWNTTISNIEFGVRAYDNLHAIPYVDAGSMAAPNPLDLYGSAQYIGKFRGLRNAITRVGANVDISLYFQSDSGSITFSDWRERLSSTSWRRTGAPDIRYGLTLGEHWFASLGPDGDWDSNGAPDVQGALYSHWYYSSEPTPDVAAGTLERGSLVGGFGGERDDDEY